MRCPGCRRVTMVPAGPLRCCSVDAPSVCCCRSSLFSFLFSFLFLLLFLLFGPLSVSTGWAFSADWPLLFAFPLVLQPQRADSSTAIRLAHVSTVRSLTRWKCTVPLSPAARPLPRLATRRPFPFTFRGRAAHTPSTPRPSTSRPAQRSDDQQPHTQPQLPSPWLISAVSTLRRCCCTRWCRRC